MLEGAAVVLDRSAGIAAGGSSRSMVAARAIGSLAPSPGGLGAIELVLYAGLVTAMPAEDAALVVVVARLCTFWVQVPIGVALRRARALVGGPT